ncbi:hypothetical protein DFR60_10479 [Hungatella effluvii]|uniref:Uncharacterized protein n=1 Tax=Hungatella effluvii TaxID=1096246 RepID=A0A2V3YKV6_9FIRM|nr:hypothetical protein [Hungatella effluvii]PXX54254.1 hypothetical protein DFR60_10479 [Hungatella effluvii]
MYNDVWLEVAQFLGNLNRENVSRKSYVRTPEYEKAEQAWIEKEKEWEAFVDTLSDEYRERVEDMKECLEIYASEQERRSYMQGYVDCVQMLYHMGLLKENKELHVEKYN